MGKASESTLMWISGKALCVTQGDLYVIVIATHLGRHKEVSSAIVVPIRAGWRAKPIMLSSDYIVGLTDGEGSFCVFIRRPEKSTWHTRVECHFYIKMRDDELPLLKKVRDFFRCGRVSFQKEYRENQKNNYRYQVSNLNDLNSVIIPFFQKQKLFSTPRQRDFNLFCRIVSLVNCEEHKTKQGLLQIQRLKSHMHQWGSPYAGNPHVRPKLAKVS